MFFFIAFLLFNLNLQDSQKYYEDDEIIISFKVKKCQEKNFGINHEYFLIEIKNKTSKTLVINFHKGTRSKENQEDKIAFVLNPNEVRKGSCNYEPLNLRIFKSDLNQENKNSGFQFKLSNIETIQVY